LLSVKFQPTCASVRVRGLLLWQASRAVVKLLGRHVPAFVR